MRHPKLTVLSGTALAATTLLWAACSTNPTVDPTERVRGIVAVIVPNAGDEEAILTSMQKTMAKTHVASDGYKVELMDDKSPEKDGLRRLCYGWVPDGSAVPCMLRVYFPSADPLEAYWINEEGRSGVEAQRYHYIVAKAKATEAGGPRRDRETSVKDAAYTVVPAGKPWQVYELSVPSATEQRRSGTRSATAMSVALLPKNKTEITGFTQPVGGQPSGELKVSLEWLRPDQDWPEFSSLVGDKPVAFARPDLSRFQIYQVSNYIRSAWGEAYVQLTRDLDKLYDRDPAHPRIFAFDASGVREGAVFRDVRIVNMLMGFKRQRKDVLLVIAHSEPYEAQSKSKPRSVVQYPRSDNPEENILDGENGKKAEFEWRQSVGNTWVLEEREVRVFLAENTDRVYLVRTTFDESNAPTHVWEEIPVPRRN